jgi:hypothetical protein
LALSQSGVVWYSPTGLPNTWQQSTTTGFVSLALAPNGAPFILAQDGGVWCSPTGQPNSWTALATNGQGLAVGQDRQVYFLAGGTLFRADLAAGGSWAPVRVGTISATNGNFNDILSGVSNSITQVSNLIQQIDGTIASIDRTLAQVARIVSQVEQVVETTGEVLLLVLVTLAAC